MAEYRRTAQEFQRLDPALQLVVLGVVLLVVVVGLVLYWRHERQRQQQAGTQQPQPTTQVERPTGVPAPAPTTPAPAPGTPTEGGAPQAPALSADLLLGNPSGATTDAANRDNYLMVKPYFALSYNNSKGIPNWVSWRVAKENLGDAPRKRVFDPDALLPRGFKAIAHKDYSGSGFDRGHLCPHADRDATQEMSFATFVMTNIIPQAPNVNQKTWLFLESYCRDLVNQRNHLYVIAGPAGKGGRGSAGPAETIAGGKVTVPAECWKVVVVVPEAGGEDDLAKINGNTRVISVVMPNDEVAVRLDWSGYRTTAADVESRTGYHFFDRLPPDVAAALRQKTDKTRIPLPANRGGVQD